MSFIKPRFIIKSRCLLLFAMLTATPIQAQVSEFALQGLGGMWVNGQDAAIFLQQRADHWSLAYAEYSSSMLAQCRETDGRLVCTGQGRDAEGRDFHYEGTLTVGSVPLERGDGTALRDDWIIRYRQHEGARLNTLRGQNVFTRPGEGVNSHHAHQHYIADEDVIINPQP